VDRRCRTVPDLARRHRSLEAGNGCQYGIDRGVFSLSSSIGHFSMSVQSLPPHTVGLYKAHLIILPLTSNAYDRENVPRSWQEEA
jgi:hypothetical protein